MENVIKGYPEVPQSITNNNVLDANALDRNQAFSFIQFIKVVKVDYQPDTLQEYYTIYLNKWNSKTNNKNTSNKALVIDRYKDFLKEITINFSNQTEKKFLKYLDFNDTNDIAIAISFFSKKLREIIEYYRLERVNLGNVPKKVKTKTSSFNVVKSAHSTILNFLKNREDSAIDYNINEIKSNLQVSLTEYFDVFTSYFNQEPDEREYGKHFISYTPDDLPSDNIFLANNVDLVAEVFEGFSDILKLYLESDSIFDNKRSLTEKYIGTDFYYISSNFTGEFVYDILLKADKPYSNFLNQQYPTTASVFANKINTKRETGFFKPSNTGINVIQAPAIDFELDETYKPDSLYIFPDPKIYTNNQDILVFNIEPDDFFKNISSGVAKLQPNTTREDTSYIGYSSKYEQRNESSDLAFLFDKGYIDDGKKDLFGNVFGLVKDNNYFRDNLTVIDPPTVKNLILNGYQFYDTLYNEGFNFNYNTIDTTTYAETFRSGLSSFTNGLTASHTAPFFPSSAYNIFFRYFCPYEELIEPTTTKVDFIKRDIETAGIIDGAYFMKTDSEFLPDPISSDLSAFSNTAQQFYFSDLIEGGVAQLSSASTPQLSSLIQRALNDDTNSFTRGLSGNFSISLQLTSLNNSYSNYEGGKFTDRLNFEYNFLPESYSYDDTVYEITTTVTNTSATFDKFETKDLEGKIYVKNAATNANGEIFDLLPYLSSKYTSTIVSDISSNVLNFDLFYDTLFIQTSSFFVIEQLNFKDNIFNNPFTDNISLSVNTNNFDKISNRFKKDLNVYYYKLKVEEDSTETKTLSVYPEIYEYSYVDRTNIKIFPKSDDQLRDNISRFVLSGYNILYDKADTPKITYRGDIDAFNLSYILKDQNMSPVIATHNFFIDSNKEVSFIRNEYVRAVNDNKTFTFENINILSSFNFNLSSLPLETSNNSLIL
jgi:hypothetical protein